MMELLSGLFAIQIYRFRCIAHLLRRFILFIFREHVRISAHDSHISHRLICIRTRQLMQNRENA